MPADQAFMDRIHRIEAGRQWTPEGIVMPDRNARRKQKPINAGQKRVSFYMALFLLSGLGYVLLVEAPEQMGFFLTGDPTAFVEPEAAEAPAGV